MKYAITALLLAALSLSAADPLFRFAQIGDPHIGSGEAEPHKEILLSAVDSINRSNSNFTVVCGDLVNGMEYRKYSDLLNILSCLGSTLYLVPGNHDVGMIP